MLHSECLWLPLILSEVFAVAAASTRFELEALVLPAPPLIRQSSLSMGDVAPVAPSVASACVTCAPAVGWSLFFLRLFSRTCDRVPSPPKLVAPVADDVATGGGSAVADFRSSVDLIKDEGF